MATVTKPIALDESLNTTEATPRNIADVLAEGIGDLIHAVSQIAPQTVYDLDDLGDVDITSPSNGQVLKYNGTSQKWENGTGGGSGDSVSWTQIVQTGTKIAEIDINGTTTDVYAPTGGGFSALLIITAGTGLTVTASKGGDTYTATETSTGTYEVSVDSAGTWTVSDGSNTATVAVSASTTYYVTLSSVPDGSTVTPTDDVSIWLACGQRSEAYTTLSEVLNDSVCLSALIADSNAVDYLVRSTTWAGITLVPNMTSATTPSGEVVADTLTISGREAYKAFDGDISTLGASGYNVGSYLGYVFPTTHYIQKIKGNLVSSTSATFSQNIKFQKTVDGTTWTDIPNSTVTISSSNKNIALNITVDDIVKGIRGIIVSYTGDTSRISFTELILCTGDLPDNATAMSYIGLNNYASNTLLADSTWCNAICNSTYFESVLNVKVPTMTGATTPSGEVITGSNQTGYDGYRAFDGNNATQWLSANLVTGTNVGTDFIIYDFQRQVTICKVYAYNNPNETSDRFQKIKIYGSDDNLSFTVLGEKDNINAQTCEFSFVNSLKQRYCKAEISTFRGGGTTGNYSEPDVFSLQFYGRADV